MVVFIVWHMSDKVQGEFSGIFYNRNICAAWLSASLPFFVASARCDVVSKKHLLRQAAAWFILLLVSVAMVMTDSRNSIAALFLVSLSILLGFVSRIYGLLLNKLFVVGATAFIVFASLSVVSSFESVSIFVDALIQFASDDTRLEMWQFGINIASNNLFYGFGPNGFSGYVSLLTPFVDQVNHVHSLPLDLWISYGLVASVAFCLYVFYWLFAAVRSGILLESAFSKAWCISFVLLIVFHMTDMPYLDARINLVGWILFAGIVSYAEARLLANPDHEEFGSSL